MSVLDQAITLKLNGLWQPIGFVSPKKAVVAMCGMPDGTPPAFALDVTLGEDGRVISARPVGWDEWIKLPVRDSEPAILTKSGPIRAPLILLDGNYNKMPLKTPKLTNEAIRERDQGVDQYTGEDVPPGEGSVDHVIPKDVWKKRGLKGSPNRWDNMVYTRKERNFSKSNKTNRQAGLKLIQKPKAPKQVPISFLVKPRHPHHRFIFP